MYFFRSANVMTRNLVKADGSRFVMAVSQIWDRNSKHTKDGYCTTRQRYLVGQLVEERRLVSRLEIFDGIEVLEYSGSMNGIGR